MPLPPDRVRLHHMRDAAREALGFVSGRDRSEWEKDRLLVLALIKSLEMIGEAASRVGDETRRRHADIPWVQIVAMRNRLIHTYYDIDTDRVWATVERDLPELLARLDAILTSSAPS